MASLSDIYKSTVTKSTAEPTAGPQTLDQIFGKSAPAATQPVAPAPQKTTTAVDDVEDAGKEVIDNTNQHAQNIVMDLSGKPSFSGALDVVGNVAGEAGDILGSGVKLLAHAATPKPVYDAVASHLQSVIKTVAGTPQAADVADAWNKFQVQHPDVAKGVSNAINIAGLLGTDEISPEAGDVADAVKQGAGAAKDIVTKAPGDIADAAKTAIKGTPDEIAAKQTSKALSSISPDTKNLTPTDYGDLLKKGKIMPSTATEAPKYILSDQEKSLATKFSPFLQDNDPVKNINNLVKGIITKDSEVGKFLAKDPQVYVKNDLKSALTSSLSKVSDITIPKDQLSEARKDLIDTFMSRIPENNSGRTFEKLWETRKNFDSTIESKLNAFNGAPTLKKEMATQLRNGIQDFIASNTKDGVYAGKMKDMSSMYRIMDMIDTNAKKTKGLTGIQAWIKANPLKAKAIGFGTAAVGADVVAKHLGLPSL